MTGGSRQLPVRRVEYRALTECEEFQEAVGLQRLIWGFTDIELLPVRLFVVAAKVGGQVFGAYDSGRMIGFCLATPGLKPGGRAYLHSHMLGVLPEYRNVGAGRQLKVAQREDALARGIRLIEWTFDPLEIKNAYFNIERLGAVVRRYVPNQYGATTSPLRGGLPTDRCVAEWWIATPRVEQALEGGRGAPPRVEERIALPQAIAEIRREEPRRAREIQKAVADQFRRHFERGLVVVGFEKTPDHGVYLLGPGDES